LALGAEQDRFGAQVDVGAGATGEALLLVWGGLRDAVAELLEERGAARGVVITPARPSALLEHELVDLAPVGGGAWRAAAPDPAR
jgi:hypothetical protein